MRWRLLTFASLLAALVGAGASVAAARFLTAPARGLGQSGWVVAAALVAPLAAITFASVFVYRHTARRRSLQAAATALLAALLTLTALLVGSILARRAMPEFLPAPAPSAKAS